MFFGGQRSKQATWNGRTERTPTKVWIILLSTCTASKWRFHRVLWTSKMNLIWSPRASDVLVLTPMLRSTSCLCLAGTSERDAGGLLQRQQWKNCSQHQLESHRVGGEHAERVGRHHRRGESPGAAERNGRRKPQVHHQAPRLAGGNIKNA